MNLPTDLPIFPLTGSLLLPGGLLPLHIFEARYRHMVEDALAASKHIGMVQPYTPNLADNFESGEKSEDKPEVYDVGCVGVIEQHQSLPFGRYLIVLRGVCRFQIVRSLPILRGYRRVEARYESFRIDLREHEAQLDPRPLLSALETFSRQRGVELELERISEVPAVALLNGLAMSLPLAPVEKQALLEAEDVEARLAMLLTLLEMGIATDEAPTLTH